jgi:RNA polymerase sigma factor for flagellar operon FliA
LERLLAGALPEVEAAVRGLARRHALSSDERDEFAAEVKLALVDRDYAILAQFKGRSSLRTFLTTVVQRLFIDYRRHLWGRWHSSAEAKRLGPTAERLELLIYRDGLSVSDACQRINSARGSGGDTIDVEALARRLPRRQRVRVESVGSADDVGNVVKDSPSHDNPHDLVADAQAVSLCRAAISRAMARIPAHDRVFLRLRYEDGLSVAAIARMSSLDQKELYRRLERLLKGIRLDLAAEGIGWSEVSRLVELGLCDFALLDERGPRDQDNASGRPSIVEAES